MLWYSDTHATFPLQIFAADTQALCKSEIKMSGSFYGKLKLRLPKGWMNILMFMISICRSSKNISTAYVTWKKFSLKCSTFQNGLCIFTFKKTRDKECNSLQRQCRQEGRSIQAKQAKTQPEMEQLPLLHVAFVVICVVISEWPALSHGLLWL